MATQVASLFGVLSLDDSGFRKGLQSAEGGLRGLGANLQSIGGSISSLGQSITVATAPIAGALGLATRASMDFSREFSNVQAVMGITGDEADDLRAKILSLGGDTVAGPQANMTAFYDIVSAGITDTALALEVLTQANATAEAGQADLTATTSAMISAINAYGLEVEDVGLLSDLFTRSVQMGVLRMDEMAQAFPQVTGLAAQFNLEAEDMAASLAFMTTQGYSATQSATFLRGMITTLINPTADLEQAIHALGYESGQSLLETEGLVNAYQLLAEQNGTLAGLITNQEALTGGLLLTKDAAADFLQAFIDGIDGATEAAGAIQDETEGWAKLQSKLQELAITVGDELAPVLTDLLDESITPLVDSLIDWTKENPELTKTILKIAGALVVLGPALIVVGSAVSAVGTLFGVAKGAVGLFGGAVALLASPLGIATVAVGALLFAVAEYKGGWWNLFNDAVKASQDLVFYLPLLGDAIRDRVVKEVKDFADELGDAIDDMKVFLGLAEDISGGVGGNFSGGQNFGGGASGGGGSGFGGGAVAPVGSGGGGFDVQQVGPQSLNQSITINVTQRAGESGGDLARRIKSELARA